MAAQGHILDVGTLFLWRFDGNLVDERGRFANPHFRGGSYVPGLIDQCVDGLRMTDNDYTDYAEYFNEDFTFESWVWVDPALEGGTVISVQGDGPVSFKCDVAPTGVTIHWNNEMGSVTYTRTWAGPISTGAWHHIGFVRSGTGTSLFFDDALVDSDTGVPILTDVGTNVQIGGNWGFGGKIDDTRISRFARTPAEILGSYYLGMDIPPPPPPSQITSFMLSGVVAQERQKPVAASVASPAFGVLGSVVKLNGQQSYDPSELPSRAGLDAQTTVGSNIIEVPEPSFTAADLGRAITLVGDDSGDYEVVEILAADSVRVVWADRTNVSFKGGSSAWSINDRLTYEWSFKKVPIGSKVDQEGFRALEPDRSLVSFSPDIVGEYIVQLRVSNFVFTSDPVETRVSVRALLVPQARGLVPDGKFIWSYIRDVWQHVEGRELFETFWSALIQIISGELLKLYQNDFNKSIRDIQDLYQRRWLKYEPELKLDEDNLTLILGHLVGAGATTKSTSGATFAVPFDKGALALRAGRIVVVGDQAFTVLRTDMDLTGKQDLVVITADGGKVLSGLEGLPWRAPHTLISKTQNFEELGVSPGDLFTLEVSNENNGSMAEVVAQVVGVDRFRLGFVLTDEEVTPEVIPDIPNKTFVALSTEMAIPGVSVDVNGVRTLSADAKRISDYLSSGVFTRQFHNVELTPETEFKVFGGVFKVHPKSIRRNRLLPVDETLRSVPVLQDWIVQPEVVEEDGKVYQVRGEKRLELDHRPYSLVENSDFIIDGEVVYDGAMSFNTGSDIVEAEDGRFKERDLRAGDLFRIITPENLTGTYYVRGALSSDRLQLSSALPGVGRVKARVQIHRRKAGTFLRFVPGGFTAKKPAPKRLWAEVSFFDNGENIENNFGLLVGLKREDLERISSDINYRQAVAGLMFAYTKGPEISKIRLGAQILLGLPFAEHRGIIRSIENDYRLDHDGNPTLGRILIEDLEGDKPTGMMRVYTYPIDTVSELAGVDTNPATGKTYVVGDTVELFAALCKGVEVSDYLTDPNAKASTTALLQQFHSFRVRANDDVFTIQEIGLLSKFLKNISPSYVAMAITTTTELADQVDVRDKLSMTIRPAEGTLVDNPYFRSPVPLMFDNRFLSGMPTLSSDEGFFEVRRFGRDLTTVEGATSVDLPGGDTLPGGEAPFVRAGDYLRIMRGDDAGLYPITQVLAGTLELGGLPMDGVTNIGLRGHTNVEYAVLRKLGEKLRSGIVQSVVGDAVTVEPGLVEDGVAPGDVLVSNGRQFFIKTVGAAGALTVLDQDADGVPLSLADIHDDYDIIRRNLQDTDFDHLSSKGPDELVEIGLKESEPIATCPADSAVVTLKMQRTEATAGNPARALEDVDCAVLGVKPGDFLVLGANPHRVRDVGYGPGVFPIVAVRTTQVTLGVTLLANAESPWTILRRR
jgi:hypothetical protein